MFKWNACSKVDLEKNDTFENLPSIKSKQCIFFIPYSDFKVTYGFFDHKNKKFITQTSTEKDYTKIEYDPKEVKLWSYIYTIHGDGDNNNCSPYYYKVDEKWKKGCSDCDNESFESLLDKSIKNNNASQDGLAL